MQTLEAIKKTKQSIARLERNLALDTIKARKAETRRKIEFGGLVVKAKLDGFSKDVILGALMSAKEAIEGEAGAKALYQSKGQAAFMGFESN